MPILEDVRFRVGPDRARLWWIKDFRGGPVVAVRHREIDALIGHGRWSTAVPRWYVPHCGVRVRSPGFPAGSAVEVREVKSLEGIMVVWTAMQMEAMRRHDRGNHLPAAAIVIAKWKVGYELPCRQRLPESLAGLAMARPRLALLLPVDTWMRTRAALFTRKTRQ
jgi:hypothetical protein